jgi:hypothetical protein
MKRVFFFLLFAICTVPGLFANQIGLYQHGTVVRMHVGDCISAHHGFMANLSGAPAQINNDVCPEYTLVTDKVVYVVVGKSSNQLIPLAEVVDFRFKDNELAVRVDDERREARFTIKEMVLRPEWENEQRQHEMIVPARQARNGQIAMGEIQ